MCSVAKSCPTLCNPWTVTHQAPLSMGFSRQEYWSGLPFPSPGGSSQPKNQAHVSFIARQILYHWATNILPCCSVTHSCLTLCDPMDCSMPGFPVITISQSSIKLMSIKSVIPSNYLILCHPFLLLPSVFPSMRIFSNESALHIRWPKYWSFSFSICPSDAYSGVLLMHIQDWFPLELTGLISLQSKGLSRVFSNTTVQKNQSFGAQPSLWSSSHIHTWLLEKP